jgi:hypothetical protein
VGSREWGEGGKGKGERGCLGVIKEELTGSDEWDSRSFIEPLGDF